ncbi:unnamed protein product [Soboliphyme baturini]|uniref:Uncharacterized protein n=1 Tax=Soboliphyme baturini TaxID=241478 RepID=A0A183IB03_9BILA|nr:unnamed protein product [Soboliphyme baturini]
MRYCRWQIAHNDESVRRDGAPSAYFQRGAEPGRQPRRRLLEIPGEIELLRKFSRGGRIKEDERKDLRKSNGRDFPLPPLNMCSSFRKGIQGRGSVFVFDCVSVRKWSTEMSEIYRLRQPHGVEKLTPSADEDTIGAIRPAVAQPGIGRLRNASSDGTNALLNGTAKGQMCQCGPSPSCQHM